ncbi:unnamed protein product [Brassica napus]|uniref:(rape) hypothetical protein n=1 Tax=Brassica napus TaxID=3708 RepID=A0A816K6N6_BRANA|nr:unnamed protein product [Brassica napus]
MKRHGIQSNTLRARKLNSVAPHGRHVFLCYKSHETWLPRVESEGLPHRFAKSFKDRRADFAVETKLTVCGGGGESDGDVLVFPDMIRYKYYPVFIFLLIAARNIISRCIFWYRALETLLGALTPIAALMNSDLLSRGAENITLLLSLLEEEDFYVRYYTLQILTALLMNSQNRLQEAILTTPRGITRLMDMLMDREVIRNEAFLLLTHLTREAEHHQGGRGFRWRCGCAGLSGVVEKSSSQQFIKPDNQYADMGGAVTDPGKDSNKLANRTVLVQKKLLDHLLMLGVESQWSPVAVRCMTFKCIGDLVDGHPKNRDILASKVLGEDRQAEPALNSILRIILQTSSIQEFVAADYVFKTFCEKCYLHSLKTFSEKSGGSSNVSFNFSTRDPLEDDVNMSFGRCICSGETDGYLETCCRAASILSHVVKDNIQCKKKALKIVLESHVPSMGTPEPLFQRIVSFIFSSSSEGPREDHEPLTRTATPSEAEIEDVDVAGAMDKGNEDHPMLIWLFDPSFTGLVKSLEGSTQERRPWGDSIFGRDDQLRKYQSKRPWLFRESRS